MENTDSSALDGDKDEQKNEIKEIRKYRRYLPQVSFKYYTCRILNS